MSRSLPSVNLLAWALIAFITYKIIFRLASAINNSHKARQLGCQPCPEIPRPFWDLLGITNFRRTIGAARAGKFPDFVIERTRFMDQYVGRTTMTYKVLTVLGREAIFTVDPKNVQAVLATQFKDFSLGRLRKQNFDDLLGVGIFSSDGKEWEHGRAMLRPSFARNQVSDLDLENRHNKNLHMALPVNEDGWTAEVDLQTLFFRLTLDSSTEFLFGQSVESQVAEMPDWILASIPENQRVGRRSDVQREATFAHAFDEAQHWMAYRQRFGKWLHFVTKKEFYDACNTCHEFIDHYVRLALSKGQNDLKSSEEGNGNSKQKYIFLDELAQQTRDPIELRSQLLNILLAGRDTTASLLGWLFFLLARHPDQYAKLRRAVIDEFGEYHEQGNITFSRLKGCHTLQHFLSETLRLFPVVPFNNRAAVKDTLLPRGGGPDGNSPVFVKKGQDISYSVHVMHHHRDFWGPDSDEFRPERWIERKTGWEFLPFNGGPRICLGQQFALTSAGFATVKMLQRFDKMENLDPQPTPKHNVTLTSRSENGVRVRLHEAAGISMENEKK